MSAAVLGILGMSTTEIAGIAIAVVLVLILVVVISVRRSHGGADESPEVVSSGPAAPSFLDEAPRDDLDRLGRPEAVVDEEEAGTTTGDLAEERHLDWGPADQAVALSEPIGPDDLGGEDAPAELTSPEAPSAEEAVQAEAPAEEAVEAEPPADAPAEEAAAEASAEQAAAEPQAEAPAEAAVETEPPEAPPAEAPEAPPEPAEEAAPQEAEAAPEEAAPEEAAPEEAAPAKRLVPLSDIIVTTSHKMVDLEDADVRRMLKDLVTYEIDQAAQYKQLGQNLDAVLQLTEAEKICHSLGLTTHAQQIREMMKELQT